MQMQSDLYGRIRTLSGASGIGLASVEVCVVNHYWLTCSFIHGSGGGYADAPDIDLHKQSSASTRGDKGVGCRRYGCP